jgi:hypothetical protein
MSVVGKLSATKIENCIGCQHEHTMQFGMTMLWQKYWKNQSIDVSSSYFVTIQRCMQTQNNQAS